jgi:hypothetical protein
MKTIKLLFCLFFVGILSSCVDLEENIVVNEDNSGIYSVSFDLGKMMGMAKQMGSNTEEKTPEKKDTTIYLKDLIQKSDSLTTEEKELYKDGIVHIKLDEANDEMKMVMTCPFKNINKLAEIKKNFMKVLDKLKALDQISGKSKSPEKQEEEGGDVAGKIMSPGSGNNDLFTAQPGKIENVVTNAEGYKTELLSDSLMQSMQQLTAIMGEMTFKTVITTPAEIKKYTGNNAEISGNKRTVSFKSSLTDMFEHPEKLAYKVEY